MATFDRTGPLRLEPQLDSSATEAFDCGVAACVMALDDASYGLIRPSTGAVRKRMRNLREATNPDQWKVAIDGFANRFRSLGSQTPRTSAVRGKGHDELDPEESRNALVPGDADAAEREDALHSLAPSTP